MELTSGREGKSGDGEEGEVKRPHVSFDMPGDQEGRSQSGRSWGAGRRRAKSVMFGSSSNGFDGEGPQGSAKVSWNPKFLGQLGVCKGSSVSGDSSPRSVQSVSSAPGMDAARKAQTDVLLRGLVERLKESQGQKHGRRGSATSGSDSGGSTPSRFHSRALSVMMTGQKKRAWGVYASNHVDSQSLFLRRHSLSAPPTPGGTDKYLSRHWHFLMARAMSAPDCCIDSRIQKKMITGIKAAVYLKINNADDLIRQIEDKDIDFTVRSGPGTPELSIKTIQPGRIFKIEYKMCISGRYCIALSCRKKRIPSTPFSVTVAPCKTQARFTIARGVGLANGISGRRATFSIIARDQGGNKRKKGGDTFVVEFDGPAEMKWARVEDHEDGLYTVTYFPTCSGWYEIFIRLHDESLVECPYHLNITPGDLSAKQSIVFYDDILCTVAGEPTSFELQARDAYCNHITVGGNIFEGVMRRTTDRKAVPLAFTDKKDGTYNGTFTAEAAGLYRVNVKANIPKVSQFPVPCPLCSNLMVRIKPGPAYAPMCMVEDHGKEGYEHGVPLEMQAGKWITFIVHSFDRCGNRRETGGHSVACHVDVAEVHESAVSTFSHKYKCSARYGSRGMSKFRDPEALMASVLENLKEQIRVNVVDQGDGSYKVSWSSNRISLFDAHVTLDGDPISNSPFLTRITPAACDPRYCWVEGKGLEGSEAGVSAHFTIFAGDIYGNCQAKGGEHFQVELVGPSFVQGSVTDNGNGTYSVSYRAIKSGRYHMHVLLSRRLIAGSPFSVYIKNARTIQSHVAMLGLGFRQAVANHMTTLKLLALDQFNNPMSKGGESFEVQLSLRPGTSCRVHTLKECNEVLTEAEVERYQQEVCQERRLQFHRGSRRGPLPRSTTECIVNMFKESLSRSWGPGQVPIFAERVVDKRVQPEAQSLFISSIQKMRTVLNCYEQDDVNPNEDAQRDCFTRSLVNKYVTRAYETASKGLEMAEKSEVSASVLDCKDGTYMVTYTPIMAGEYSWTIVHNGVDVSPGDEVVSVSPSTISERESVIYGFGIHHAIAGELAHFVLQGADESGNTLKVGKDNVEVEIYKEFVHPNQDTDILLPVDVVDLEDGRYLVTYLATDAGYYIGEVYVNGRTSSSLGFRAQVYPSIIDSAKCKLIGDAAHCGVAGKEEHFHIQACDAFGNERHFCGDRFFVVLRPMFGQQAIIDQTTNQGLRRRKAMSIQGNQIPVIGSHPLHSARSLEAPRMADARYETHAIVSSCGDGTYLVEYRVTAAGRYTLVCSYKNPDLRQSSIFCQTVMTILPSTPFGTQCIVSGSGLLGVPPRVVGVATIMITDRWGNYRSLDPLPYEIKVGTRNNRGPRGRPSSARFESRKAGSRTDWESDIDTLSLMGMEANFCLPTPTLPIVNSSQYSNGTHELDASFYRVLDGREFPGGVVTVGETTDTFDNWFKSTGLDERQKKHLPDNMSESEVKLYTVSYRARSQGTHQLRITLNGLDITGSPFRFPVQTNVENMDPLTVHPDQYKEIDVDEEVNLGTNPLWPKLYPQYVLNGGAALKEVEWVPPSAPSTEVVCRDLNSWEDSQGIGKGKGSKMLGRRGGFVRNPCIVAEQLILPGGKSTLVFGGWAKGTSRLVSRNIVEEQLHEQLIDDVEAKRRSDREKHKDFLVAQIHGMIR